MYVSLEFYTEINLNQNGQSRLQTLLSLNHDGHSSSYQKHRVDHNVQQGSVIEDIRRYGGLNLNPDGR